MVRGIKNDSGALMLEQFPEEADVLLGLLFEIVGAIVSHVAKGLPLSRKHVASTVQFKFSSKRLRSRSAPPHQAIFHLQSGRKASWCAAIACAFSIVPPFSK